MDKRTTMCWKNVLVMMWVLSVVLGDLPSEEGDSVDDPFPTEKCEAILQGCLCFDYEFLVGIKCSNVSNFTTFVRTLADGSIFEENTTYEITIQGVRTLPRRALEGLIVYRIYLDDPLLEQMEQGVFDGALRIRRFHVRYSSLKEVPDFRMIRNSFRNLNIDNSLLTSLAGDGLKNLSLLETVSFVNNSIQSVDPHVFQGTENIIIFDMSHNELSFLPPNLLDSWKQLKKVVLSHNRLLHVDHLFARTHPQFIYLDYNNLTNLDSILHPNMSNVETLQLSYNPLKLVTVDSFNDKVNNTRFLYLDHCQIRHFNVWDYDKLNILATLDLSYNLIERVTNQTVHFGFQLELDLVGNKITEFNAELPYNVKRVYLSGNELTSLGSTLQFSQMAEVSMADNRIGSLSTEDFRGVHGVQVLDLQGNRIGSVERFTFSSIRKDLVYLDLSRNRIRFLDGCVRYLSLLTSLNLTNNQLQRFEEGEFTGLNELTELYLQGNQIVSLGNELQQLPQLQYLVISHNRIRMLKVNQIPERLQYLYFAGNPFSCNCELFPFLQYLNVSETPGTDVPLCTADNSTSPASIRCPEPCSCACASDKGDYFMAVDCSNRNLTELPAMFRFENITNTKNTTSLVIEVNRRYKLNTIFSVSTPFVIEDTIGGLDLSNNSLESLGMAKLPPKLRHLKLNNNLLRDPPPTPVLYDLPDLTQATLSGNPWKCDCDALGFKKWILSKTETLQDTNNTRCGPPDSEGPQLFGRLIWTLTDLDLCPADIGLYMSLAFGILTFSLFVAACKIAWTRYEMNIKVWLYAHGVSWVKEKDIDRDKTFDAFISFSHKDENFVIPQIIKVIEAKEPNVRLCLHYKHFTPGEFIHDNILNAVQNSKRTVLILSRNFLESEWCLMEFRAAHVQALKDRVHRIVVIKLGDLPKEMDPSIQVYLDSTTYLTWGEKYFWDNLLYVLPTSKAPERSMKDTCPPPYMPAITMEKV